MDDLGSRSVYSRRSTSIHLPSSSSSITASATTRSTARATSSGRNRSNEVEELLQRGGKSDKSSSYTTKSGGNPRSPTSTPLSLDEHIGKKNDNARASSAAASLYEIMDIHSLDKGHANTWASSDWCAEARKSRDYLRSSATTTTTTQTSKAAAMMDASSSSRTRRRQSPPPPKRNNDDDDDDKGGAAGYDEFMNAMRGSIRGWAASEKKEEESSSSGGITNIHLVERENNHNMHSRGGNRSNYDDDGYSAASASQYTRKSQFVRTAAAAVSSSDNLLPARRKSTDNYHDNDDDDDEDEDNGTFRSVVRSGRMDTSAQHRTQSNGNGGLDYYSQRSRQHPPQHQQQQRQSALQHSQGRGGPPPSPSINNDSNNAHHHRNRSPTPGRSRSTTSSPPGRNDERGPGNNRGVGGDRIVHTTGGRTTASVISRGRPQSHHPQSRGPSDGGGNRSQSRGPPPESYDGSRSQSRGPPPESSYDGHRSQSRGPPPSRRDDHYGHQNDQRYNNTRPPPRDPSPPRQDPSSDEQRRRGDVNRTPCRRGGNVPLDPSQSGMRSSTADVRRRVGDSLNRNNDKLSQSLNERRIEEMDRSSQIEEEWQKNQRASQQQQQQQQHDDSRSIAKSKSSSVSTKSSRTKQILSSKATVLSSSCTHSTSGTPETGALTSSSGKSSQGSFLRSRMSSSKRNPPSTPPQEEYDESVTTESRTPTTPNRVSGVHNDSTSGYVIDDEEIITNSFDRKGYCVQHPTVQLRKKKLFGGWKIMMTNCPDCCVEEMRRLKRVSKQKKAAARASRKSEEKKSKLSKKNKSQRDTMPMNNNQSVGRERSRSRSRKDNPPVAATNIKKDVRRSRSKSKSRQEGKQQDNPSNNFAASTATFEFVIPDDVHSAITSSRSPALEETMHKSISSKKSKRSAKSVRTEHSAKTGKSEKSGRTTRTSKSGKSKSTGQYSRGMQGKGGSTKKQEKTRSRSSSRGRSSSSKREGTSGRRDSSRSQDRSKSRVRSKSQSARILVAKMPYKDQYNREGSYTGEINEHGQPNGRGSLMYNNGTVFEGKWKEGFCNEMEGIHVSTNAATPVNNAGGKRQQQQHGRVSDMKWSDVNGFSGLYSGEVNSLGIPDGDGLMHYSNGVVEEGLFCNGVYQPPTTGPSIDNGYGGIPSENGRRAPSSSMSVWSLKSSPTMANVQGGPGVLAGRKNSTGASSGRGAPSSVHIGPSGHTNH